MKTARILLVEDHADTRSLMRRMLEMSGHRVYEASSCEEAFAEIAQREFDLLISDLGLPDGSGDRIMAAIKERSSAKGIALSGYGADRDIDQSLKAGFSVHLTKPTPMEALETEIQRLLEADK